MSDFPRLLAIDCATLPASVALLDAAGVRYQTAQQDGRRADAWLGLAIEQCLAASDLDVAALGGLAVCVGPGTFTGIRVGIATALGLAAPTGLAVAGVTSLEALALLGLRRAETVAACIDARREQVYAALYGAPRAATAADRPRAEVDPVGAPLWGPAVCAPRDVAAVVAAQSGSVVAIGSGARLLDARAQDPTGGPIALTAGGELSIVTEPVPLAAAIGEIALRRWRRTDASSPDWPAPEPVYLRPPDARPPRNPLLAEHD